MLEIAETGEEAPMLVPFGVLIAIAPFAVVIGLLAWTAWRERRRREVEDRQIVLTDGIHERLGAAAAPIVCRRRRGWQVRMAVPFQRPAVTEALLAIVLSDYAIDALVRDGIGGTAEAPRVSTPEALHG
jgi:hypothetical protein